MKCECNAFESNQIGIFTDFTRELGAPVNFPAPPEPEQELVVLPTKVDTTLSQGGKDGKVTEDVNDRSLR